jgi:hypothetical protein
MSQEKRTEMNTLMGLIKNAGWSNLVLEQHKRLKHLQQEICTADISSLIGDKAEFAKHIERIAEAKAILAVIEYPAKRIAELQYEMGDKNHITKGEDDDQSY